MDTNMTLATLPKPQPGKAGRLKLAIVAVLALGLLAGLTYWLTRDEAAKQEIVSKTEDALHSAGLDPLINATKELLGPPLPPPPVHSVGLAAPGIAAHGTLIQGTVPTAADLASAEARNADASSVKPDANATSAPSLPGENTASAPPPGVMPQQREDSVIRPDFVYDLANWLVARYKPVQRGGRGQIGAGIQTANMRYGANMRGMERRGGDPASARAYILRYAFNPTMLEALYGIYADRLVDEVARAALAPAQGKALSEAQLDDLYKAYAAFFTDLSAATGSIAAMPDLKERIEAINMANQQTITLHRQITEQVFALDEAREEGNEAAIPAIEARVATLNERYRSSLQRQSGARAALVSALRGRNQAQRLDDDSLLFLALWVERRMEKQPDALDAVRKASALLGDLSRRFENAGNGSPLAPAGTRQAP